MGYMQIFKDIRKNKLSSVYLFSGKEEYVKQEALDQLVEAIIDTAFKDMNCQTLDGSKARVDEIINACETLPFMADRRIVIVRDSMYLMGKRQRGEFYRPEDEKRMQEYIQNIPPTSHLVFYTRDGIDKRMALYRTIKKHGYAVEFAKLKEYDLKRWIKKELALHGKTITSAALDQFVYLAGSNLDDIKNELSKLIAFVYKSDTITEEDILETISPTLEVSIFQLVEAIGNKNVDDALALLYEMLDRGEVFYSILPMIGRQLRLILLCRIHNQKGYTNSQIARTLKIHPYGVGKYISQGRNFSEEELTSALSDCLNLDHSIKQGKIDARLGLEMLILSLCAL